ncbi:hypothetical protein [Aureimonas populi]|uniref:Uncharacterized protein n=1 Tax=Aureimonas populi TaxID=1701758 RepID=A0ABW5CIX8_9HYPH|nr:hypothetical protein [Aureimonas populi]
MAGLDQFKADSLDVIERSAAGVGGDLIKLTTINRVEANGRAVVGRGPLVRNCGEVVWKVSEKAKEPNPQASRFGFSASAVSAVTTTTAARNAGDTTIPLAQATPNVGAGPGGFIRYDDGSEVYEIAVRSHTAPTTSAVVLACDPLPVAILGGAIVTVISTVRAITMDEATIDGFAAGFRTTGSATAKPRDINLSDKLQISRWLNIGADIIAGDGGTVRASFDNGGLAASGVKYGVSLGDDAEGIRVAPRHGKNNRRIRYGVAASAGTANCLIDGGVYLSIDGTAVSPAAIFVPTGAVNVKVGANNLVASGITPQFPTPA